MIVASQVYKATYTGVLKTYLDLLPQKGLEDKIVLPLFIGGTISHLLSMDSGMKPALTALGATHILIGVFAEDRWVERTDGGGYNLTESLQSRLDQSVDQLIGEVRLRKLTINRSSVS